jgi:uncharacterized damage-inducible protein DinB
MPRLAVLFTALLGASLPPPLPAQTAPIITEIRRDYTAVRDFFLQAAEEMPDSLYSFRPTPAVRTFARQVAHVADDQYNLCSRARGEVRHAAYTAIEDSLSTKHALLVALQGAFAYCDTAYATLTQATADLPTPGGKGRTRLGYLNWNMWHTWEHYGNVVVYLRLNGLVPPSSQNMAGMKM